MTDNHSTLEPKETDRYVTSIISATVKPDFLADYEKWIAKVNNEARKCEGFFSVDIIRPKSHIQPEYVVILKFDSYENLKNWLNSETLQYLNEEAVRYLAHMTNAEQGTGMELWFSRPDNQNYFPQPKYYKRVLMGLIVVYPLSTVIGMMLSPFMQRLPPALQTFFIIAIMSCLMTWPVMPYLTRWLTSWLYPKPKT